MLTALILCVHRPCIYSHTSAIGLSDVWTESRALLHRCQAPALSLAGLNGQFHQVLPGLSVFRAYDACYFVMQVPKKVVL
jgi:hypothetical protein